MHRHRLMRTVYHISECIEDSSQSTCHTFWIFNCQRIINMLSSWMHKGLCCFLLHPSPSHLLLLVSDLNKWHRNLLLSLRKEPDPCQNSNQGPIIGWRANDQSSSRVFSHVTKMCLKWWNPHLDVFYYFSQISF